MKTRVVHVNDKIPGAVYIGRAVPRRGLQKSFFANPYKIGETYGGDVATRESVLVRYEVASRIVLYGKSRHEYIYRLREIAGKPLACWCRRDGEERTDDNACHGDVLVALIRELGLESDDPS